MNFMNFINIDTRALEAYKTQVERELKELQLTQGSSSQTQRAMRKHLNGELAKVRKQITNSVGPLLGSNRHHAEAGIVRIVSMDGLYARIDDVTPMKNQKKLPNLVIDWNKYKGAHARGMGRRQYRQCIKRKRTVNNRTKQIRGYTGTDRQFILHIITSGRVQFLATGQHGRKGQGTWGMRGAISAKHDVIGSGEAAFKRMAEEYGEYITREASKHIQ